MLTRAPIRVALAAVIAALAVGTPTGAQDLEDPVVTRIARISPYVDAEQPLLMEVQVLNVSETTVEAVSLHVSLRSLVFSRSQLRAALDQGAGGGTLVTFTEIAAAPLEPGGRVVLRVHRELSELGIAPRTGVYPIEARIVVDGREIVHHTAVPLLTETPESPLNLTWLLPVDPPTALKPDGTYSEAILRTMDLATMTQQMEALAQRPGMPVTLLPQGSLVDTLADLSDGFTLQPGSGPTIDVEPGTGLAAEAAAALNALRRAAAVTGELGSVPYARADLAALTAHGLEADVVRHVTGARRAIEGHLGRTPSFRFFATHGSTVSSLEASALRALGVEGLPVDPAILSTPPSTPPEFPGLRYDLFGVSRPIVVRAGPERLGGLVVDADLAARLQQEDQGVLLSQAIIAETASSWLEAPGLASERLLVLGSGTIPAPAAFAAALDGMAAAPWLQMRTASDALQVLPPSGEPVPVLRQQPPDTIVLSRVREARAALALLEMIAIEPHPRAAEFDRMVLIAASGEWETDLATGAGLAQVPTRAVDQIVDGIRVERRVVTLTSRTGTLPVTLTNASGFPIRVRVALASSKANFLGGSATAVELRQERRTIDFEVEALATGAFPVEVRVEPQGGGPTLATGSVVVRSTAVSAVALAAVGGGVLFLIIGSVRRGRRRRNGVGARGDVNAGTRTPG